MPISSRRWPGIEGVNTSTTNMQYPSTAFMSTTVGYIDTLGYGPPTWAGAPRLNPERRSPRPEPIRAVPLRDFQPNVLLGEQEPAPPAAVEPASVSKPETPQPYPYIPLECPDAVPEPAIVEAAPARHMPLEPRRVDEEGRPIFKKPAWWTPPEERDFH